MPIIRLKSRCRQRPCQRLFGDPTAYFTRNGLLCYVGGMDRFIVPQASGSFEPFVTGCSNAWALPAVFGEGGRWIIVPVTEPPVDVVPAAVKNPWDLLELLPGYILAAKSENKSDKTIKHVCLSIRTFYRFLVDSGLPTDIRLISVQHLQRYALYLRNKARFSNHRLIPQQEGHLSEYTVNNYLRGLQSFCAWLRRDEILDVRLFEIYRIAKPPEKTLSILTPEQVEAMIKAATGGMAFRDRLIVLILYDNGMRASELCRLDIDNVFLDRHLLRILGKGRVWREVPIGTRATKELWQWLKFHRLQPANNQIKNVFLTSQGKSLNKDTLEIIVRSLGNAAGITGVKLAPHTLRHSFATHYLKGGGDLLTLQRIMGHKSVETLKIYVHLSGADLAEAHKLHSPGDRLP